MTRAKINTELMFEMHKLELFRHETGIKSSGMNQDKKDKLLAVIEEFQLNLDVLIDEHKKLG